MSRASLPSLPSLRTASVIAAAMLSCTVAVATPANDAERARLVQERAAIEAQYTSRHAECSQRFVVTSCVDDAKRDRRRGLDGLRARQIVLDESRRKERSTARRSELSGNAAELARREAARVSRPAPAASDAGHDEPSRSAQPRQSIGQRPSPAKRHVGADDRASGAKSADSADRQAKEGRSRATFDARKQQAAEHRDEVLDKAAKRAQEHKPAAALPIPTP